MQFFQRKFAVTSVVKNGCILTMIIGHFYIPLTSKKGKFQPKTNIFPSNNNHFSIKPSTVLWAKIY